MRHSTPRGAPRAAAHRLATRVQPRSSVVSGRAPLCAPRGTVRRPSRSSAPPCAPRRSCSSPRAAPRVQPCSTAVSNRGAPRAATQRRRKQLRRATRALPGLSTPRSGTLKGNKKSTLVLLQEEMEGEVKSGGGTTQWTTSQSSFVQTYLANLVAEGNKTSTGFKKVHLNGCAKALNDRFKINRTGDQICNHLKTLKKKYSRINHLRNLSAALWDEDQFIISFDHEHYTNHFEDARNKGDDEFINKPLPYYGNLATIFGNSVATGQFAKTSNDPLGADVGENSPNAGTDIGGSSSAINPNEVVASSGNRPSKRARKDDNAGEGLVEAIDRGTQTLATLADAIKEVAAAKTAKKPLPEGLFQEVENLPGFDIQQKANYYAHLVANPDAATAFMTLPLLYKITWVTSFFNDNC